MTEGKAGARSMTDHDDSTQQAIAEEILGVEVTTICDRIKECTYCFAMAGLEHNGHAHSHTIETVLDEGALAGYHKVQFTGGEPLLHRNILEFISYAIEKGFEQVVINTHGMMIDAAFARELSKFRNNLHLTITINGPEQIHEMTRGQGSYERVMRGLENALQAGLTVSVFTTVTSALVREGFAHFVKHLFQNHPEISRLSLWQMHRVVGDEYDVSPYMLSPEEFISLVKQIDVLSMVYPVEINENPLYFVVRQRLNAGLFEASVSGKGQHSIRPGRAVVLINGEITGVHSSRFAFGHLQMKNDLTRTLSSTAMNEAFVNHRQCPACEYVDVCRLSGMLQPTPAVFSYDESAPFCVQVNRILDTDQDSEQK